MIGQITPLVKAASKQTWWKTVTAHVIGASFSAIGLGLALGVVGQLVGLRVGLVPIGTAVVVLAIVCAVHDSGGPVRRLPSLRRQTPKTLECELGPIWAGFAWGLDLAQGWTTRIEFAGYYVLVALALLSADPLTGALVLGVFGIGRALPVFVAGFTALHSDMFTATSCYVRRKARIAQANAAALALLAGYLVVYWS
jgi:cytochrome c biogenesis protein CcdA